MSIILLKKALDFKQYLVILQFLNYKKYYITILNNQFQMFHSTQENLVFVKLIEIFSIVW